MTATDPQPLTFGRRDLVANALGGDFTLEASQAYIRSQAHAGWTLLRAKYDDGGFSGSNTDRPALQRLLEDVRAGKIDVIVVYKVDRLTRSLADFAKVVELFDKHNVSFVSVRAGKSLFVGDCVVGLGGLELLTKRLLPRHE
jgi:hypothetical protein